MKELNRKWLIFIAAVFAIFWLGSVFRNNSLRRQLRSVKRHEVTIQALDADSGHKIPTGIKDSKCRSGQYFPADLTQTSIPPSATHLQWIAPKPVKFTVTSPGYSEETVKIEDSPTEPLSVELTKLTTQRPPAAPSP